MGQRRVLQEVAVVYCGIAAATWLITHLRGVWAVQYGPLALAAVFLVTALRLAQREPGGARRYGIDLAGVLEPDEREGERALGVAGLMRALARALPSALRELGVALAVAAVVFPPFWLAFVQWNAPRHPFTWQPPSAPLDFVMAQLVVVGLPEEALFRGYFQTALEEAWPKRIRLLGAEVSPAALVVQALLFALLHFLVGLQPARLAVFFPGLLFGWLRALRGGIGAAVFLHAMSNFYSQILTRGYL